MDHDWHNARHQAEKRGRNRRGRSESRKHHDVTLPASLQRNLKATHSGREGCDFSGSAQI